MIQNASYICSCDSTNTRYPPEILVMLNQRYPIKNAARSFSRNEDCITTLNILNTMSYSNRDFAEKDTFALCTDDTHCPLSSVQRATVTYMTIVLTCVNYCITWAVIELKTKYVPICLLDSCALAINVSLWFKSWDKAGIVVVPMTCLMVNRK